MTETKSVHYMGDDKICNKNKACLSFRASKEISDITVTK